ncbi:unnamed protein product [Moneuplotes crassus]|uniref:Uncharacterized protein n=2 Tax=Euplotes crassus TaxID=5936 RepID=A0AAD1Y6J1_EUPCR|nr:unnamed protein product [Moneuplotes crassus]
MKTYGEMKHFGKPKSLSRKKADKKQNSSANTSLNTSKISMNKAKFKAGMDYFLESGLKQSQKGSSKKSKKKIKPRNQPNDKVRESGINHFGEKGNRSASPHTLSITKTAMKRGRNHNAKSNYKDKFNYQAEYNTFNTSLLAKNPTFDYLQNKSMNRSELNRTQKKADLDRKKFSESQIITKNNAGAVSNLGIYQNKTFYTVNQPKRAGTTLTSYQEDSKRKRAIKKLVTNINMSNPSSGSNSRVNHRQGKDNILQVQNQYKSSVKGNEKIFLPIYEVLNHARIDRHSSKNRLNDLLHKSNPIRQGIESLNKSNEVKIDKNSLTYDDMKGVDNLKKRESIPSNHKRKLAYKSNIAKKSSSSCGVRKKDIHPDPAKLYNRTDAIMKNEGMIASRNNAYNSLGDCYKMPTVTENNKFERVLPKNQEINRAASTSFNVTKVADINSDLLGHNLYQKQTLVGSNRKGKESELKESSTHISHTNNSDSRYKNSLINPKTENSCRLQFDTGTREESKRSHDLSFKTTSHLNNPEELSEVLRQYNLDSAVDAKRLLASGALTQATADSENGVISLLKVIKDQEIKLEAYKSKEQHFIDKIYNLERKLKESNHKIELLNLEHGREVASLKSELEKKNEEASEKIENFIMNQLDLDAYNITSDDFGSSKGESEANFCAGKAKGASKISKKTISVHPLVPKLDLQKIFDWREKANNDNVIMIRISESRIEGEDNFSNSEIENFNESVLRDPKVKDNIKIYFPKGTPAKSSSDRIHSLLERKQMIIDALNTAYSEDDEEDD